MTRLMEDAKRALAQDRGGVGTELERAQVLATLALAEQARVGNLLAYATGLMVRFGGVMPQEEFAALTKRVGAEVLAGLDLEAS